MVYRVCVEKKPGLAPRVREPSVRAAARFWTSRVLKMCAFWNRYDVEGIDEDSVRLCHANTVFSEPQLDLTSGEIDASGAAAVFAVEPLPGQFDQRADSAAQCIQLLSQGERPRIRTAQGLRCSTARSPKRTLRPSSTMSSTPSRAARPRLQSPRRSKRTSPSPRLSRSVDGFTAMDESALSALLSSMGLAMDLDDLKTLQAYFRDEEHRDPTVTEVRVRRHLLVRSLPPHDVLYAFGRGQHRGSRRQGCV